MASFMWLYGTNIFPFHDKLTISINIKVLFVAGVTHYFTIKWDLIPMPYFALFSFIFDQHWLSEVKSSRTSLASRIHFEVLGLSLEGQILSLEASSPRKLSVLGSRTALFLSQLKFCWKTPEISRKIGEYLFCFCLMKHRRTQGERT